MIRRHRALRLAAIIVAAVVVVGGAIVAVAAYNLTAIIARSQTRILRRVSNALGRPVKVGQIKAAVGWGLAIEADDLSIADDPAFSRDPFLQASQASLDVEFLPLLKGKVKVHQLTLTRPTVRVLRRSNGKLNLDSLGGESTTQSNGPAKAATAVIWSIAREVSIKGLEIEEGTLYYSDATLKGVPLQINHLGIAMAGFHTGSPFEIKLGLALFSDRPNLSVTGKAGPMLRGGVLHVIDCPLDLAFKAGPLNIDSIRTLMAPGAIIPATVSMPDPLSFSGTARGNLEAFALTVNSALSGYRIVYHAAANHPGTAPLVLRVSGNTAIDGKLRPLDSKPGWDINASLTQVASSFEGAQLPAITDLTGRLHLTAAHLEIAPTTFLLGSQPASLQASADSLTPLRASYSFKAGSLQLSQIVPTRAPGEFVRNLDVKGTAGGDISAPIIQAHIRSESGLVQRLSYHDLDLTADYDGKRFSARPLSIQVFDGSVLANVNALVAERPPFDASASIRHVNVSELLRWLEVGSGSLTGFLTVDARVSGAGTSWKEIQPTLRSSGRVFLSNGELRGVNIVAVALNKIAAAPVVSQLVSVAFRSSHQGLFAATGTDLRQTSMDYVLANQRVNTSNLLIVSPDYQITGAGWFDFDKNIDMSGDIKLTLGLSAAIPVVVMGRYPALLVLPNIPKLAERTAIGVVSAPVNIIKGGANAVGNIFGGIRSVLP